MASKCCLLACLFSSTRAARKRTASEANDAEASGRGSVANLFTYGAPHVSAPALSNGASSDNCFPGYRVVNTRDDWLVDNVDIVPALLQITKYQPPLTKNLELDQKGKSKVMECGDSKFHVRQPSTKLHDKGTYIERSSAYGDSSLTAASAVGLATSYMTDIPQVQSIAKAQGWTLIGTSSDGEDVSHLFQHPSTLACQVTFEGSDSFSDWVTDAAIIRVSFCGLSQGVHIGFRNEVRRMTGAASWQANVRSKFKGCSSVWAVGHSLGGAQAALFSGCANSGNSGNSDYEKMGWSAGTPTKYPSI